MSVGQRVEKLRDKLSQKEFGVYFGITSSNISSIEKGKTNLTTDLAIRICEKFNCSLDWLLRGVGSKDGTITPKIEESDVITIKKDKYISLLEELNETKTELLKREQERSNTTNKESITKA